MAGLLGFWLAWGFLRESDWYYGSFSLAVAFAAVVSCGCVWWWGNRMQEAARRSTPWLDRREWAQGEIAAAENATSTPALGSLGLVAGGVALFLFVFGSAIQAEPALKWVALVFGAVFSAAAIHSARFRRKFGKSFFRLSTLPGAIGGTLEGTVCIRASFPPNTALKAQLRCLKLALNTTARNDGRSLAMVLWQGQQTVHWASGEAPGSSKLSVKFDIPSTCPESADPLGRLKQVVWQLTVTAPLPGLSYAATFEVPIYKIRTFDLPEAAVS